MREGVYKVKSIRLFIQLSRPIYILVAVILYFLGIGIAHYLSGQIIWPSFFLGLAWLVLILLAFQYLNEYFDLDEGSINPAWWRTPFSGSTGAIGADRLSLQVPLWAGLTSLTISASLTVLLVQSQSLSSIALIMLGLILVGEMALALPPIRLVSSGYGELVMSIIRVGIIPAMAYALQGHDLHRLLIMVAFPLVTLHLGMLLAFELPTYASDVKFGKRTIIIRIGWQRGMLLHNFLILGSFVVFGLAFVLGLPLSVGWSVIFVLPVGLFQIWMMNRIADGAKPNWNLLTLIALATFGLATYLLTFAFWTH
jgi:1,4-dihydroxy-2-naphthoate octaprenyltransferase